MNKFLVLFLTIAMGLFAAGIDLDAETKGKVVLVDFYAPWCPPCRTLMPMIDEIATERSVLKVNVTEKRELAEKYGITHLPTLLIVKDGQVKGKITDRASKQVIFEQWDKIILE